MPLIPALLLGVLAVVLTLFGKLGWQGLTITACVLSMQLMVCALMSLQSKRYFEELYNLGYGLRRVQQVEPTRTPTTEIFVPAADELVVEPGLFDDSAAAPRSPEPYEETRFRGAEQRVDA